MFVAIYQFIAKPGQTEPLLAAWRRLTELIYEYEGSLGSRMHATDDPLRFVAYATWPDKATWEASGNKMPPEADLVRKQMRDAAAEISTLEELSMVDDLLATHPHPGGFPK